MGRLEHGSGGQLLIGSQGRDGLNLAGPVGQLSLKSQSLFVGHLQHLGQHIQAVHQLIQGGRRQPGRLHDRAGLHIDQAGMDGDAVERRDAADDEILQAPQTTDFPPRGVLIAEGGTLQFQLAQHPVELAAFDEIVAPLEAAKQGVGHGTTRIGPTDVATHLEIRDAESITATGQGQANLVDVTADLRRVPRLLGGEQGRQGVLQRGPVARSRLASSRCSS